MKINLNVLLTLVHEVFEMSGSCLYQILCYLCVPCECCTLAPSHKGHLRTQQDATHWKGKYILVSMDYCVTIHNILQKSECSIHITGWPALWLSMPFGHIHNTAAPIIFAQSVCLYGLTQQFENNHADFHRILYFKILQKNLYSHSNHHLDHF
jgi:hypothetical protein